MMNKIQFNDLINYLKNRPSEAQRLAALVLGAKVAEPEKKQIREWLTIKEVGERVGRGKSWVVGIMDLLPEEAKMRRDYGRREWRIDWTMCGDTIARMR